MFTFVNREEFRYFQSTCGMFTVNSTIIIEVVSAGSSLNSYIYIITNGS